MCTKRRWALTAVNQARSEGRLQNTSRTNSTRTCPTVCRADSSALNSWPRNMYGKQQTCQAEDRAKRKRSTGKRGCHPQRIERKPEKLLLKAVLSGHKRVLRKGRHSWFLWKGACNYTVLARCGAYACKFQRMGGSGWRVAASVGLAWAVQQNPALIKVYLGLYNKNLSPCFSYF